MKKYLFLLGLIIAAAGLALLLIGIFVSDNFLALLIGLSMLFAGLALAVFLRVFVSGKKYASPTKTFIKICLAVQLLICALPIISYVPIIISSLLLLVFSVSTGMVQYKFGMPCEYLVKIGFASSMVGVSFPLHILLLALWG